MKQKIISLMLTLCLCCSAVLLPTQAAGTGFQTDAGSAAQFLKELSLFQGTDTGFELDRGLTRQEGITILVHLLGKQDEAVSGSWKTPFTDVDPWALPYVGYAYTNGITSGTGASTFGAKEMISKDQYATFLLRALGYTVGADFQWDSAAAYGASLGLPVLSSSFTRGSAVIFSRAALEMQMKSGSGTLADSLIAQGVFTSSTFQQAKAEEALGVLAATARKNDSGEARKNVYYQFVENNFPKAQVKMMADLTQDGKPELIVAIRRPDAYMPHITGTEIYIYTYVNQQVKKLSQDATTLDMMAGYQGDFYLYPENGKNYLMNVVDPVSYTITPTATLYAFSDTGRTVFRELEEGKTANFFDVRESYIQRSQLLGQADGISSLNHFAGYVPVDLSLAKTPASAEPQTPASGGDVYTIGDVSFTIELPDHWKNWCTIQATKDSMRFVYTRDKDTFGGHVFTISVQTPDPEFDIFRTLISLGDGRVLGYWTPQDVQFNHLDSTSTEQYNILQNEVSAVAAAIRLAP